MRTHSQVKHPTRVHLLRGNHEFHAQNVIYGFNAEVHSRGALLFGSTVAAHVYRAFHECFNWMPFCALINDKILCMHGGISQHLHKLEQVYASILCASTSSTLQLESIVRPISDLPDDSSLPLDLVWADVCNTHGHGYHTSERGISNCFDANEVDKVIAHEHTHSYLQLCRKLNIELVVRGHTFEHTGFHVFVSLVHARAFTVVHRNMPVTNESSQYSRHPTTWAGTAIPAACSTSTPICT